MGDESSPLHNPHYVAAMKGLSQGRSAQAHPVDDSEDEEEGQGPRS